MVKRPVSSWGRLSKPLHECLPLADADGAAEVVCSSPQPALAYGNGRSYGDVCLNSDGVLWPARGLDRFLAFDAATGILECQAGATLGEVIDLVLPQGWFVPVTPGTRFVTVGGAVANDVHGKNHHAMGSFGEHVLGLVLLRTDGSRIECAPDREAPWFGATVGGMGLTGLIVSVRLQLRRVPGPWLDAGQHVFDSLDAFFELSATASVQNEYTVAWLDCNASAAGTTRGILFHGNHGAATHPVPRRRSRSVPLAPPFSLVNRPSVKLFNALYLQRHRRARATRQQHYSTFFYPLDNLLEWNRLYGPRGFYQYQCVVPAAGQVDATRELLSIVSRSGEGSFLAVLKTFGNRPATGLLSFPMPGTTLAIDFPNRGEATMNLFKALDAVVSQAGGRLYAAKDARMSGAMFKRGYPQWQAFERFRDPGVASDMSRRLFGS